ncbi:PREDICTED: uncharacterized protein LOC101637327 [Condylura cristata]|uniref:uncharacterized protein LOC101637327 n=1 Tax=Condylura cristata TaxID=143302 RepID=UPI000334511C|nr:PREDICTED: uncharacterized protein LOC101637327 [Condylura cristata]
MAFLVAGTLQVAAQVADARESLGRKGKYSLQGPRMALTLSTPEVPASTAAVLDATLRALGCGSCQRREVPTQDFLGELAAFREQLDARGDPVGCALVALVAPSGQLKQPQPLVRELSRCRALRGRPKVFLLLSGAPGAALESGAFLTHLRQRCGRAPRGSLQQLLTEPPLPSVRSEPTVHTPRRRHRPARWPAHPGAGCTPGGLMGHPGVSSPPSPVSSPLCPGGGPRGWERPESATLPAAAALRVVCHHPQVFCRVAEESSGATPCPFFRSSLRGSLCLHEEEPRRPERCPGPSSRYDLSGARAALLLAVGRGRPGAEQDLAALGDLCQTLGFKTTLRTDPTAQAFQEELAQFRERLDTHRGPVSVALVALMAHGGPRGQLLGADGQEVRAEVLVQELSRCRALRGRPKIFLLQACRGGHRDAGAAPPVSPWPWRWLQPPATPSQADVLQVYADAPGGSSRGVPPGSWDQADILRVYAAPEGYVAYRDERGSDFIQTLVEVLRADPAGDLLELLTEVNRRVCEQDVLGPGCDERRKACLEIRSSLRRGLSLRA